MAGEKKIEKLKEEISALKRQWPAHSVPPAMLQKLDALEDALELERKKMDKERKNA